MQATSGSLRGERPRKRASGGRGGEEGECHSEAEPQRKSRRNRTSQSARESAGSRRQEGGGEGRKEREGAKEGPEAPFAATARSVITVNGRQYMRLEQIGRGGSSKVFRVLGPDYKTYALKKIKVQRGDKATLSSYANEIELLRRLRGQSHIITLADWAVEEQRGMLYMVRALASPRPSAKPLACLTRPRPSKQVLEHGEIDLSRMIQRMKRERTDEGGAEGASGGPLAGGAGNLHENFIRLTWQQMLEAVSVIHGERIVHSDLKPANFVFVRGQLKLIDFGIAKAINNDTTNIMRDSQVSFGTPRRERGRTQQPLPRCPDDGAAPFRRSGP